MIPFGLNLELIFEDVKARRSSNESEERRGWVEGTSAELWVGLQSYEVRVIYKRKPVK